MGDLSGEEWCALKRRGREILRRARDPEVCPSRLRVKAAEFFNSAPVREELNGEKGVMAGATPDLALTATDLVSNCERDWAVSSKLIPISNLDGEV